MDNLSIFPFWGSPLRLNLDRWNHIKPRVETDESETLPLDWLDRLSLTLIHATKDLVSWIFILVAIMD